MADRQAKDSEEPKRSIEPVWPCFGLSIGADGPSLKLCQPKLLPLKTYSYKTLQVQALDRLDMTTKTKSTKITD